MELEFRNVGVWGRGEKLEYPQKTSQSKDENQQQTQPTYDTNFRNETQATKVGGDCSCHCAIPAPKNTVIVYRGVCSLIAESFSVTVRVRKKRRLCCMHVPPSH